MTFTLVITDFGIPKVIGGNFNVLATDVFAGHRPAGLRQGAVVALLLLAPGGADVRIDHYVPAPDRDAVTARARALRRLAGALASTAMTAHCAVIALLMLLVLGMAVFASFASFWPTTSSPACAITMGWSMPGRGGLCQQPEDGGGTAGAGTDGVRPAPTCSKDPRRQRCCAGSCYAAARDAPDGGAGAGARPGYIFFLQRARQSAGGLYHTITLLTLATIVHFYTSAT